MRRERRSLIVDGETLLFPQNVDDLGPPAGSPLERFTYLFQVVSAPPRFPVFRYVNNLSLRSNSLSLLKLSVPAVVDYVPDNSQAEQGRHQIAYDPQHRITHQMRGGTGGHDKR